MIIFRVARAENSQKSIVDEDSDWLFQVLSEMKEELLEDGDCNSKNLDFGRDGEFEKGSAELVSNDISKFISRLEHRTRLL